MDISKQMIREHLRYVFGIYDDRYEEAPGSLEEYKKDIENMKTNATFFGDIEALLLAFEYILIHPEINILDFVESSIEYEEEDARSIIDFALKTIRSDTEAIPSSDSSNVRLVDMRLDEWRIRQKGNFRP
ncbi:hypothetical protein Cylst_4489 [Cylindrospermum stagnale PCC 7417]|uniref:CdiI immunity protein domain-containing protein n=1 Tax=Cylindrospermum stagnale PCC 7417 TaxID=56107 RepID=K9X2A9_9NOST|nr:hypothetical protein [Cylindrospermum stagnale]AFZ26568.1 hypothetical protein Cylst_4489 [Cylindrospermum stagnale PCC 7417]